MKKQNFNLLKEVVYAMPLNDFSVLNEEQMEMLQKIVDNRNEDFAVEIYVADGRLMCFMKFGQTEWMDMPHFTISFELEIGADATGTEVFYVAKNNYFRCTDKHGKILIHTDWIDEIQEVMDIINSGIWTVEDRDILYVTYDYEDIEKYLEECAYMGVLDERAIRVCKYTDDTYSEVLEELYEELYI